MSKTTSFPLVELHFNTGSTKDSITPPEKLVPDALREGLECLIITHENSNAGAPAAHASDPEFVMVGEEIITAFVNNESQTGGWPQISVHLPFSTRDSKI
jgi:hypothetical protein